MIGVDTRPQALYRFFVGLGLLSELSEHADDFLLALVHGLLHGSYQLGRVLLLHFNSVLEIFEAHVELLVDEFELSLGLSAHDLLSPQHLSLQPLPLSLILVLKVMEFGLERANVLIVVLIGVDDLFEGLHEADGDVFPLLGPEVAEGVLEEGKNLSMRGELRLEGALRILRGGDL